MLNGEDEKHSRSAGQTYKVMMLQVARDYPGVPDVRTLTVPEIVFFYNALRPELKRSTKGKSSKPRHG